MIAIMGFLIVVAVVATAAAWLAEEGLRRAGIATRWIWLGAMATPLGLLALPALVPDRAGEALARVTTAVPVFELAPLIVGPEGGSVWMQWAGLGLGVVWALTTACLAAVLLRTHRALIRERADWPRSEIGGREVFVSPDRGPAVAGVTRPWIVLPEWSLSLASEELDFIVMHEEEHVRAGDSLLLSTALGLLVLTPWNPVAWLQLRLLRTAMEVDCDRRVLRRAPDPERYGNSLLAVAARASGHSLGLAAFTEKSLSLKTRIVAMTTRSSRWLRLRAAALVLLALLVGVQACAVDNPVAIPIIRSGTVDLPDRSAPEAPAEAAAVDLREGPAFTPFTVAPSITNRNEVIEAMQAAYPPLLKDAGVGGTTRVYFFINEVGLVEDVRIDKSSGHPALDDAAIRVANVYRFEPALNRDKKVPVWVSFPITFQTR